MSEALFHFEDEKVGSFTWNPPAKIDQRLKEYKKLMKKKASGYGMKPEEAEEAFQLLVIDRVTNLINGFLYLINLGLFDSTVGDSLFHFLQNQGKRAAELVLKSVNEMDSHEGIKVELSEGLSITTSHEYGTFTWELPVDLEQKFRELNKSSSEDGHKLYEQLKALIGANITLFVSALSSLPSKTSTQKALDLINGHTRVALEAMNVLQKQEKSPFN